MFHQEIAHPTGTGGWKLEGVVLPKGSLTLLPVAAREVGLSPSYTDNPPCCLLPVSAVSVLTFFINL